MLVADIMKSEFTAVQSTERVADALAHLEENQLAHVLVVHEDLYMGILDEEELLDQDPNTTLQELRQWMIPAAVKQDEFFLIAVKQMARYELEFIPVINNEHQLIGKIDISRLLPTLSTFVGADEPGGMIVLEMDQRNFSFGEISRLVETNDAQITQLNTFVHPSTRMLQITLQLSTQEVSDVVATFQRYEYHVVFYMGEEQYTNELKENYHHLMNYLNI